MTRPQVFIGTSGPAKAVALAIQSNLSDAVLSKPWMHGQFLPGGTLLSELQRHAQEDDFAVFVFTPDGGYVNDSDRSVRDNVLFECGLFLGAMGAERVFIVSPDDERVSMPSDLSGAVQLRYQKSDLDRDTQAALGPACNVIRQQVSRLGRRPVLGRSAMYPDLTFAAPAVVELALASGSALSVKVIGATAMPLYRTFLEQRTISLKLTLKICVVNPEHPQRHILPTEWPAEVRNVAQHLLDLSSDNRSNVTIEARVYDHVPCVHGFMLNDTHLFMGHFRWRASSLRGVQMAGAQLPIYYYERSSAFEDQFQIFESWFNAPTSRPVSLEQLASVA